MHRIFAFLYFNISMLHLAQQSILKTQQLGHSDSKSILAAQGTVALVPCLRVDSDLVKLGDVGKGHSTNKGPFS
ncbi:hypothetical protein Gogos_019803 [Gossypium gossypioides]|uniref:Uncharacterized protein n=1 Tax=Gossypium gossypioides TaxID=34282 RepID=A0A7J9CY93_GOSGO|nr:hypothetical protein [Gossypium gossypioides]